MVKQALLTTEKSHLNNGLNSINCDIQFMQEDMISDVFGMLQYFILAIIIKASFLFNLVLFC